MPTTENKRGVFALMVAHCAGMLDLVALPVWVGTLIVQYRFDPQQAGGLATLFLIGASLASVVFAPRFTRHEPRQMAVAGFALAAVAFIVASQNAAFPMLAVLHLLGGMALSFTHGTIGHAANPHRVFALVGLAIGIFGIAFLGGTPGIVAKFGGPALFLVFAGVMAAAALVGLFFFPGITRRIASDQAEATNAHLQPLERAVWFSVFAIALLAMVQAMTLSFFESIGLAHGFGRDNVTLALVIYGIVTHTSSYPLYAASGALMAFTILFTHTYAFGLLARLDPTGRAVAGTPAMPMVGAAVAPFLGGTLVKFIGFEAIGYAAIVQVAIELALFNETRKAVLHRPTVAPQGRVVYP
jgi:MFS family permease